MGRALLFAAAALLLATAGLHAAGASMVDAWLEGLGPDRRAGLRLVWLTDSIDWAVVAILWALAAWKREPGWLGAAAVATLIPAAVAIGILAIDPGFFGGWMLLASVALALTGQWLLRRARSHRRGGEYR